MPNKTITLTWTPATHRADNSTLPAAEIDSVKVYSDQGAGGSFFQQAVVPVASGNQLVMANVTPGTYRFKLATIDTLQQEGAMSAIVNAVVPALPAPPNPPSNAQAAIS